MVGNIIKLILVIAVMTLIITIFPIVYEWMRILIMWVLSLGKWGVIGLTSLIIGAIIGIFN